MTITDQKVPHLLEITDGKRIESSGILLTFDGYLLVKNPNTHGGRALTIEDATRLRDALNVYLDSQK